MARPRSSPRSPCCDPGREATRARLLRAPVLPRSRGHLPKPGVFRAGEVMVREDPGSRAATSEAGTWFPPPVRRWIRARTGSPGRNTNHATSNRSRRLTAGGKAPAGPGEHPGTPRDRQGDRGRAYPPFRSAVPVRWVTVLTAPNCHSVRRAVVVLDEATLVAVTSATPARSRSLPASWASPSSRYATFILGPVA